MPYENYIRIEALSNDGLTKRIFVTKPVAPGMAEFRSDQRSPSMSNPQELQPHYISISQIPLGKKLNELDDIDKFSLRECEVLVTIKNQENWEIVLLSIVEAIKEDFGWGCEIEREDQAAAIA